MASLDDILTTQKNGVIAINNLNQKVGSSISDLITVISAKSDYYHGKTTSAAISAQTQVATAKGFLVSFTVTVAGTVAGTINNSASTGGAGAANVLAATPLTIGTYQVGARFDAGLVVTPGTGQSIVVTYSLD